MTRKRAPSSTVTTASEDPPGPTAPSPSSAPSPASTPSRSSPASLSGTPSRSSASSLSGTPSLDELMESTTSAPVRERAAPTGSPAIVGDVIDARHPTLRGRALIRWRDAAGATREQWLAAMAGVTLRVADRVLLTQPLGWSEPLVTGVVDGFSMRPEAATAAGATLALRGDECVRVTSAEGTPLVEVYQSATGPVVRLCQRDVTLELEGALRVDARSIELTARQGGVTVRASDDVTVQGETVKLN